MAAGLSRKQRNQRMYTRLKQIQWKLERTGVKVNYKRWQLFADITGLDHLNGFNISHKWSFASNGECAGFAYVTIEWNGQTEVYGWMEKAGTFEQGLSRVVELFSRIAPEQRPKIKW